MNAACLSRRATSHRQNRTPSVPKRAARGGTSGIEALEARIAPARAFGINATGQLVSFDTATPGTLNVVGAISGLLAGDTILGMDFRPADGLLYAIAKDGAGTGHIYKLAPQTGAATLVSTLAADPADLTSPFTTVNGTDFGVDFNPVPDRLRVVSDTGQNLRINVSTGLVTTDTDLNPAAPHIVGAAYTNSFAGATTTTLYTIDSATDQLLIQNPPNNGTQTVVGGLGVNVGNVLSFDIFGTANIGYLAATSAGVTSLYTVNLGTGAATLVGAIGAGTTPLSSLSVKGGFTATAGADGNGPFATFTGTADAETLIITEATDGVTTFLRHNRFDAGDAGFASPFDFDSTVAGEQKLTYVAHVANVRVNVTGNGGGDFYSITRSELFGPGNLNVPGGTVSLLNTTTTGGTLTVDQDITADFINITSDNIELFASNIGTAATKNVTLKGFQAGRPIFLQTTSGSAVSLTQTELSHVHGAQLTLGDANSGAVQINDSVSIGVATLKINSAGGVSQTGSLTVNGGTGTLDLAVAGNVDLASAGMAIGALNGGSTNGHLYVADVVAGGLTVKTVSNSGGPVFITAQTITVSGGVTVLGNQSLALQSLSTLDLNGPVNAGSGSVLLVGPTGIAQSAAGIVTAGGLITSSNGAVVLDDGNQVTGPVSLAGGSVIFSSQAGYTLGGLTIDYGISSLTTFYGVATTGGAAELRSGGAVTQLLDSTGEITASSLLLKSVGGGASSFTLNNPINDVTTIAGNVNGALSYTDANSLATGTLGGTVGVTTNGAPISLTALNGGLLTIASAEEVQTVTTGGGAGTYTLTFNGQTTAALAFNGSEASVEAALNALSTIGGVGGSVSVSRVGLVYTVTFHGTFEGQDEPQLVATPSGGATAVVATISNGATDVHTNGGDFTATADNILVGGPVLVGAGKATLQPSTAGTKIDLGGADAAGVLGLTAAEISFISAGTIVVGNSTAGDLTVSAAIAPAGTSQLELVSGGQIKAGALGTLLTVPRLGLTAESGIGLAPGFPYLVVDVDNLEATTNTGGMLLTANGPVTIGGVNSTLTGLTVTTSGDLHLNDGGGTPGSVTLTDTDGLQTVTGGSVSGNVTIFANGVASDVVSTVNHDAISAPRGNILVGAGRDILLGTVAVSADNDVRASGSVTFTAGRDVTIAGFADVASDDFGQATGGDVTVTAGHDISISASNGDDASLGVTGATGGDVTLTAGVDRFVNISAGFSDAVFSGGGDVTINADRLAIDAASGVTANAGIITVQPVSFGRLIDLGSTTDAAANTLEISATELTRFFTPLLRIGNPAAGNITVTAPVDSANAPVLSLSTGGSITSPVPGSITAEHLALHAGTGIGTAGVPLKTIVEDLAFLNATGLVSIANTGLLTITSVDDLPTSANHGTTTTLTATAGPGPTPGGIVFEVDTLSHGTLSATAIESAQPQDDVRVKFLINVTSETGDILFTAGDGVIAEENSVLSAFNEVKLTFGANDLDGVSFVDLRGFIFGRLLTLQGSALHETITLANLDNIDVQVINIHTGVGAPDSVNLLDNSLSHEINASLRLGGYISVLGFKSEVRIFENTTADTLTIAGREGNDTITAQPGIESVVSIILDGGTGNDTLTGNGILVGGDGDDILNGGIGNDTLIGDGGAQFLYGLTTGNALVRFAPEAPDTILSSLPITGLLGADTLIGIDVRPSDGKLYAVGNDAGVGHLYTIDPLTGAATLVATLAADPADATSPYVALNGTEFGFDFNPVPDRLRVVSDLGQNLRINPDTGLVTTDDALNGGSTGIVASAYANNFAGATTTTLYGIDAATDQLYLQNPPNNGTLTPVGPLGLDVDAVLGFDIVPGTGNAYASLVVGGISGLYSIDLFNGAATLVGNFGSGVTVRGLTVAVTQGNNTLHGNTGNDLLVGGLGNDTLEGGDGNDTLLGLAGNDILSGGAGLDGLLGGLGDDTLRETRDADFTLTNAALTIGTDGAEALNSIERVELTGGLGANIFHVGAFTGKLKVTGGAGSDTLDHSAAALGVTIDLDAVGTEQFLNTSGVALTLGDKIENYTGTVFNDLIYADALTVGRTIDGLAPANAPGVPGAPVPPGDKLVLDGQGQFVVVKKTDFNTGTIEIPGFANVAFNDIETIATVNSTSGGGFSNGIGGGGAFSSPIYQPVHKGPESVATGDVNGDGIVDIVTANNGSNDISVLIGLGNGTFAPAVNIKSGGIQPIDIQLADLDNDGDRDIVTSNRASNKVAVLKNDGLGNFSAATNFAAGTRPTDFALGDLNGDTFLDLVAVNQTTGRIAILLNTGTGDFGAASKIKTGGVGPSDVAIGDFNLDGKQDIVVTNTSGRLSLFKGTGSGTFTVPTATFNVGRNPTAVAIADFNNDGNPDLVVNHVIGRFVSVLLGNGTAVGDQFKPQIRIATPSGNAPRALLVQDFNGDGNVDLGLAAAGSGLFRVFLGTGDGLLLPPVSFDTGAPAPRFATGMALGDFNGDGAVDLVLTNRSSGDVSILLRTQA